MTTILTAGLPIIGALAGAIAIGWLWGRYTRPMSWPRLLRLLGVPLAFLVLFFALSALAVALVGGEVTATYVFDGPRGPAVWQVNAVVVFDDESDTIERRRLDIIDVDTGRRIARRDYVHYWALPIEVEVRGEGPGIVWLHTEGEGLHAHDIYDGHRVVAQPPPTPGFGNRFTAGLDRELERGGRRFVLVDGTLRRVAQGRLAWEAVGTGRWRDPYFVTSPSLAAEDAFFIADEGNLSCVAADGTVRWTQQNVLDSKRIAADAAFIRDGRVCVLQDNRLACFGLADGQVQWVIR